jgi:hypothetical protein
MLVLTSAFVTHTRHKHPPCLLSTQSLQWPCPHTFSYYTHTDTCRQPPSESSAGPRAVAAAASAHQPAQWAPPRAIAARPDPVLLQHGRTPCYCSADTSACAVARGRPWRVGTTARGSVNALALRRTLSSVRAECRSQGRADARV